MFRRALTAGANDETAWGSADNKFLDDVAADGKQILFDTGGTKTKSDLWVLPLSGERKLRPFVQTEFNEGHGRFSPDGKWVAYASDESGRTEVYVQPFPGPGQRWQISTTGGDQPTWRGDGKELFYLAPDRKLMAVSIQARAGIEAGAPQALFEAPVRPTSVSGSRNQYVAAADGQRFLVIALLEEATRPPITVVTNWPAALRK